MRPVVVGLGGFEHEGGLRRGGCDGGKLVRGEPAQDVEPGELGLALQAGIEAGLGLHRPLELQPAQGG